MNKNRFEKLPLDMRALTLWRPWPHAILYGGKRVENRPWKPWLSVLDKPIAIHAGFKYDRNGAEWMRSEGLYDPPKDEWCPKGCIVGTMKIVGYYEKLSLVESKPDPWFFGPFGWILGKVIIFDNPVHCKGSQGLWPVPVLTALEVQKAYAQAVRNSLSDSAVPE